MKATIIYYSATGNTEMMADHIEQVLSDLDYDVTSLQVEDASMDDALDAELLVLGSPAMGVEEIEEYDFRPFFDDLSDELGGKKLILFGSYDWGDGEWLENWHDECVELGAEVIAQFKSELDPDDEVFDLIEAELKDKL